MKTLNFRYPAKRLIAVFFCLMLLPSLAGQGLADSDPLLPATTDLETKEIHVSAQRLISDSTNNTAEFIGNVRANQGDTMITADSLKIILTGRSEAGEASPDQSLEKVVATGNVEIKFDNRLAVAQQAVYITAQRVMILTGPGAKITDGENTITGETITFYRDDGRFTVEGGSNGRVTAVILPKESGLE